MSIASYFVDDLIFSPSLFSWIHLIHVELVERGLHRPPGNHRIVIQYLLDLLTHLIRMIKPIILVLRKQSGGGVMRFGSRRPWIICRVHQDHVEATPSGETTRHEVSMNLVAKTLRRVATYILQMAGGCFDGISR